MPFIESSDPLIQNLPVTIDTLLPDLGAMSSNAPAAGLVAGWWSQQAAFIWQEASQVSLGNLAMNVGVPVLKSFDIILESLAIDPVREISEKLIDTYGSLQASWSKSDGKEQGGEAVAMTVEGGVGMGVNAASVIPILGWVVKVGWQAAKGIRWVVKVAKEANAPDAKRIVPVTTFSPDLDNIALNRVVEELRGTKAWGRFFGPPAMGEGVGTLKDFGWMETELGGIQIVRRRGDIGNTGWAEAGWMGMIPGSPRLHQGLEISDKGTVREMGDILLPSARNIAIWLWRNIVGRQNRVTPSLYCVNVDDMMLWGQYILDLKNFVLEADFMDDETKLKILKFYDREAAPNTSRRIFGWGSKLEVKEHEWDNYGPVRQARVVRDRQMAFMDTLMCAYVDDSFDALKKDADLKARWELRRSQLLEHPARCEVDLSSVPDSDYREALKQKGVGSLVCRPELSLTSAVLPYDKPATMPPEAQSYGTAKPKSRPRKKGIGLAVPFIALSATAYWAHRTGKLKALKGISLPDFAL